ncbi:MAG TPA: aldehyde dehydrogenase [Sphingomonas sp.]|jgi:acyl-CoA reductase-like NAD-dependent aldehyde dehydrogenase|uniref:aldehyde dehydrogenase n=1 Tax=Sphingomonas sp. TaxID=28214 RepID=UPI002ED8329B
MKTVNLLIDNRDVAAEGDATFDRIGPIAPDAATRAAAASIGDAGRAADAAAAALPDWAALGPNARRTLLLAAAAVMERRADEFVAAMQTETGATRSWAGFNVHLGAGMLREAAALTTQISGEVIPSDRPGCVAMAVRRPAGVVLGIAPWNAPVILGVRAIATALACGNTVVLKASEACPATHWLIGDVLREAGFAAGVVNVVSNAPTAAGAVVEALIRHRAVRRVNFTGSTKVGRIIARLCAEELKPALLELGGKAPLIVLDDADVDAAVAAAAFGAFFNSGQICMSTERIIVTAGVGDAFMAKFAAKVATLTAGDPAAGTAPLGAVIDRAATAHIAELVEDAVAQGAVLYRGPPDDGVLMGAAALDHVTPAMRLYREESFGPITAIIRVADADAAIRVANETDYGLTSAIFSRDVGQALQLAARLQVGMCHINGPTVHDEAQMPFGGTKASGYGRFGGRAGIAEFTELQWITIDTQPVHYPI